MRLFGTLFAVTFLIIVTLTACASLRGDSDRVVDSTSPKSDPPRRDRDLVRK